MNFVNMLIDVFQVESILLCVQKLVGMDDKLQFQEVYDVILWVFINDVIYCIMKEVSDVVVLFVDGDLLCIFLMGIKCFSKYFLVNVKEECCKIVDIFIVVNQYVF